MTSDVNSSLLPRMTVVKQGLGGIAAILLHRTYGGAAARAASLETAVETIPPLMTEWADAWSAHDPDRLVAIYAPGATYVEMPTNAVARGTDEIRAFVEDSLATFPDIQVTPRAGFQGEQWAVLEGDFTAHSTEGRLISAPFAVVFELEKGTISRSADYFDLQTVMQQMGAESK